MLRQVEWFASVHIHARLQTYAYMKTQIVVESHLKEKFLAVLLGASGSLPSVTVALRLLKGRSPDHIS